MICRLPYFLFPLFTFLTLLSTTSGTGAAELPPTMRVIEVKKIDPKPDPMSFDSEPVSYWCAGSGHGRIDMAPDDKNGMHELIIMNDPNVWMIDLNSKSGRHIVDHSPPLVVHFQVFGPTIPFEKGKPNLEFANEVEYFKYRNAKVSAGPTLAGRKTISYECTVEGKKLSLLTDTSARPLRITYSGADAHEILEYLRYDEVPSDAAYFEAPAGIKIAEEESLQRPDEPKR
jgi:hypothetical protein